MQLIILGTSSTVPTKKRNHSAYFLRYKNEGMLFDCGEGTQKQLKLAGIRFSQITKIFISHWHGDHMLGLPGLLQSMAMGGYTNQLQIYGPPGSKKQYKKILEAFESSYEIKSNINDVTEGEFLDSKDFTIEAYPLSHRTECYGFRFVEKDKRKILKTKLKKFGIPKGPLIGKLQSGKTITINGKKIKPDDVSKLIQGRIFAFISDTRPNKGCNKLAKNADVLLCESTYSSHDKEKAREYFHLTAQEAAQIASHNNVQKLILTHFSARYKDLSVIEQDARVIFDNSFAAKEFMKIDF